jgi:hypothetical protein
MTGGLMRIAGACVGLLGLSLFAGCPPPDGELVPGASSATSSSSAMTSQGARAASSSSSTSTSSAGGIEGLGNGATCSEDNACKSGHCADGVCCDSACGAACTGCKKTKTGIADGVCGPMALGTDPDGECPDAGAPSCGANGKGCNGDAKAPACVKYDNTTICTPQSCDAAKDEQSSASLCDGSGLCVAGAKVACGIGSHCKGDACVANPACWQPITTMGAPTGRTFNSGAVAIWTGKVVIVWGGSLSGGTTTNTGAMYDPALDKWTVIDTTNAPSPRDGHRFVWTGKEAIAWGGFVYPAYMPQQSGARFDPAANKWAPMSSAGPGTWGAVAAWSGSEMMVWSGTMSNSEFAGTDTGSRYDPAADKWTGLSTVNAAQKRSEASAIWDDVHKQMLVWGGGDGGALATGGAYDPVKDSWSGMTSVGAPKASFEATAVWTGSKMIVWGGAAGNDFNDTGGVYDPSADKWQLVTTVNAPKGRIHHVGVWTGKSLMIWGGNDGVSQFDDGAEYDPVANQWKPITNQAAPGQRRNAAAVWMKERGGVFVWGGYTGASFPQDGAVYYPACPTP